MKEKTSQRIQYIQPEYDIEIHFIDRIMGKRRTGIVSFTSPAYYHFRVLNSNNEFKAQLFGLITPVSTGLTRLHLVFPNEGLPSKMPQWITHFFGNKFLETDIWLHNCEIEASKDMKDKNIFSASYGPQLLEI